MRAGIYARISLDRTGISEAPDRQLQACRDYCKARGWDVAQEYVDRNLSAWDSDVKRPQFDQMLAAARDRKLDAIVSWKLDRLTRRVAQLAPLADELAKLDVAIVCVEGGIDTSSATGRGFAKIVAAIAEMESENTSERKKAKIAYDAQKGRYFKGGFRSFGRNRDGTLHEIEAQAIQDVASRYLGGESFGSLAKWLNAEAINTPQGGHWTGPVLSRMIREPHLRGIRRHGKEEYVGDFEPILNEFVAIEVLETLRARRPSLRNGRTHLLSGIVTCAACGCKMGYGSNGNVKSGGQRFYKYSCRGADGPDHCGRISAGEDAVDRTVRDLLIERLRERQCNPDPDDIGGTIDEWISEAQGAMIGIEELAHARFVTRTVNESLYRRLFSELQQREAFANSEIARLKRVRANIELLSEGDPATTWEAMTVLQRRALVKREVATIRVMPAARRGGNVFDKSRVVIHWADEVDQVETAA